MRGSFCLLLDEMIIGKNRGRKNKFPRTNLAKRDLCHILSHFPHLFRPRIKGAAVGKVGDTVPINPCNPNFRGTTPTLPLK